MAKHGLLYVSIGEEDGSGFRSDHLQRRFQGRDNQITLPLMREECLTNVADSFEIEGATEEPSIFVAARRLSAVWNPG